MGRGGAALAAAPGLRLRSLAVAHTILIASAGARRLEAAARWLDDQDRASAVVVVGATPSAAAEAIRRAVDRRGAVFGWQATTLTGLATTIAAAPLAAEGLTAATAIALDAVAAGVIDDIAATNLGRYAAVAGAPGFHRALGRTLRELRLAGVTPGDLGGVDPELGNLARAYEARLAADGLADNATVGRRAIALAAAGEAACPLLGVPLLLLDVALTTELEAAFMAAVAAASPEVLATVVAGDEATAGRLEAALGVAPVEASGAEDSALARLQRSMFRDEDPPTGPLDDTVTLMSAPGEGREAVEIARRILALAGDGVSFDRVAILLRSPETHRSHLDDALRRAAIPAHFARGVVRPDPGGRAFMALLRCAAEGLSARRFAEYLSLGVVPDSDSAGAPPSPRGEADAPSSSPETGAGDSPPRVPRRWERLLVEAAVVGGRDRWARRLAGLAQRFRRDLEARAGDDPDHPALGRIQRDLADLQHLESFALPLVADLAGLPEEAPWGEWLAALTALASRSLANPDRVLAVLSELQPMAPVGPVAIQGVLIVLSEHLLAMTQPPPAARYGKVYVAPVEEARGLAFDVVFVPGLAEKLFPRKITEDPILLDESRRRLQAPLATNADRVMDERLAFMVAAGAARRRLVLSYPRLDADKARPRVPSFYALEALRAATGSLPMLDDMVRRADEVAEARVGWPAPASASRAIDEAEYDLAALESLRAEDPARRKGAARYLLLANPHLARALRFRGRRWQVTGWTPADGLVKPSEAARRALANHRLDARSYSPTALQNYAQCPYRFFLHALHRLSPREEAAGIEVMDPLQRGSLVHDVQFETLSRLQESGLLPVTADNLEAARGHLETAVDGVARRYRDDLAPAIERVWEDGVDEVKADLAEWLRRATEDASGFVPWRFELTFGLPHGRPSRDPRSVDEAVNLDSGLILRGAVDLVEQNAAGELRITDHKTGRSRVKAGAVIDGGRALQPVLYSLAVEKLFAPAAVTSGRLYYCTSAGNFETRDVPLDGRARASARIVAEVVGTSLDEGFLPAAPAEGACRWCDYQVVCGPHEERRTARKRRDDLAPLERLRHLP